MRTYKFYFKYRLENGQTGTGYVCAKDMDDAKETAKNRFGAKIDFYDFTTKNEPNYTGLVTLIPDELDQPETETAEADETETNEQEEETMMNYNYLENMQNDVLNYIAENIDRTEYIGDRDSLESTLNDDLWTEDSVTGNASGSYFCNAYKAKDAVLDNMEYCTESLREFCTEPETIAKHFLREDWEYFDVTIRCYLLGQAISEVLDELENAGYFEENDADESDIITAARESITA